MTLAEPDLALPPELAALSLDDAIELAKREHLGVWTERTRGFENAEFQWEWSDLAMSERRLCVVAPRDHSKSETFSVDSCTWRIVYRPGCQCVVFTSDVEVAKELKERVDTAVRQHDESLLDGATVKNVKRTEYANGASIRVRTTGQKVRGLHPDHIVGDDVLDEANTLTHYQRKKVERWWFGTVEGMAHPGTWRIVGRHKVWMPPTTIHLVGTPFHASDLLMSMRVNPVYRFRRYAAEFAPSDLVPGTWAVEAA